jgi:hypothetical protein
VVFKVESFQTWFREVAVQRAGKALSLNGVQDRVFQTWFREVALQLAGKALSLNGVRDRVSKPGLEKSLCSGRVRLSG